MWIRLVFVAAVLHVSCGGGQDPSPTPQAPPPRPADAGTECCCGYQLEASDPEDDDGLEWHYMHATPEACDRDLHGTCGDETSCRMGLAAR
jgi:hypothetical protein